jgi:hypothetical protein
VLVLLDDDKRGWYPVVSGVFVAVILPSAFTGHRSPIPDKSNTRIYLYHSPTVTYLLPHPLPFYNRFR